MARDLRTIEKVTRIGDLFDLYGSLLTDRQREMVELHYLDDWSLAEIAEQQLVSRQAVHDNLRRAEEQLESYESALGLLKMTHVERSLYQAVLEVWEKHSTEVPEPLQGRLKALLSGLGERYK